MEAGLDTLYSGLVANKEIIQTAGGKGRNSIVKGLGKKERQMKCNNFNVLDLLSMIRVR